eukprot:NODE_33_length_36935_cov_1.609241.p5 type:complete len:525 gc:universal NODE_33_length_36935_cov_1.609241:13093-11519(-)
MEFTPSKKLVDEHSPLIKKKDVLDIENPIIDEFESQRFPRSIAFIVGNEFAERFTFYGIKAVLFIFLTSFKKWDNDNATALLHSFNMLAYFMPLIGSILADSYWGKYKTILYLSILYCFGSVMIAISAMPDMYDQLTLFGLLLLAIGTGGIKPNVSSFGADQLVNTPRYLPLFFSLFYFSINAGSVLSMFFTPMLRGDLKCFGRDDCFPAAFGVPSLFMMLATFIFVAGKREYLMVPASGNNLLTEFSNVIVSGVSGFLKDFSEKGYSESQFWIHPISEGHSRKRVLEFKALLSVFKVMIPLPLFWALYDQQGSRWTSQAMLMNPHVTFLGIEFSIKPDQMPTTNAVLILAFIPLFVKVVYPMSELLPYPLQFHHKPLRKMSLGMLLCGFSFLISSFLQLSIDKNPFNEADPNSGVCILWQIVQYVVVTAAEIMFSITGLEFAYAESPSSLKSMAQAGWLLTVALGNLIVVVIAESKLFSSLSNEMLFYSIMIWSALIFFMSIAYYYVPYKDRVNEEEIIIDDD